MPLNVRAVALCIALAPAACTTPADVSRPQTETPDKNARYDVHDTPAGFTVDVRYSRYQMIPDLGALIVACRSLALSRVADEARARGREVQPIAEQDVRVSTGRNIFSGRSACRAFAEARWK